MSNILNIDLENKRVNLEIVDLKEWKLDKKEQKVYPYFTGKGNRQVKEGIPTYRRYSVIAIIKHNKEDKYLCVDTKNYECKSFVMGGIEKNETVEEAAIREVQEETGYVDVQIDFESPIKVLNHFYAGYKGNFNRLSTLYFVFGKLKTDKNIGISKQESKKHVVKWIYKEELKNYISLDHNKYALSLLLDKDATYTGKGVIIK